MDIVSLALIALVVVMIGVSKSAFAGALGVFAVPLLMFKFSAVDAIALVLPLLIIADAMSVKSFWKKWDTSLLKTLVPGAVIGIASATLAMDYVKTQYLQYFIALICIAFALKNIAFTQFKMESARGKYGAWLMSATSGITSTLVHAGGPPLIMYFTAIGLQRTQFVATAAAFFAIMNLIKLVGVLSLGLLPLNTALTALAFFPLAIVGNWLGLQINARIDKQHFLKVMNYLLLVLGIWLVFK